jgi:trehalose 6-phosphate phosphatase
MIGAQDVPIAGVHGAEFRHGARQPTSRMTAGVGADALAAVRAAAERVAGAWVEDKRSALSVHFRDVAPHEIEPLAARLNAALSTWTDRLTMRPGRKVFEIVQRDISKAAALGAMMKAPPFAGRVPVMIGDDHADDVAMQAAVRLGGFGLGVAGEYFTQDASTFRNPAEVRAWLHRQINEETP